ncbi:MAG: type II toxin-antitoxin system RelE/ParE family toxin [Parvularculaceae bacterium]
MRRLLLSIVETPQFLKRAAEIGLDEAEREELITLLANDPKAGISLGGGLWKMRVARKGGGKSGGYRVLHFYRTDEMPLFLLTVFAKNEQATISAAEKKELIAICDEIAATYRKQK